MAEPIPAQESPYSVGVEAGRKYRWGARGAKQPFCDGSHKAFGLAPPGIHGKCDNTGMVLWLQIDEVAAIVRRHP